jgi:hypothetical protein
MKKVESVISHWHQLIEEFQVSPLDFYKAVEVAIDRRQVPNQENVRIDFKEGGLLTCKREYLRVIRGKHAFDICAAPFGTGFFFSWWLIELPSSWFGYFLGFFVAALLAVIVSFQAGVIAGLFLSVILVPGVLAIIGVVVHDIGGTAEDGILAIPWIGSLYARIFDQPTYYQIDSALMFQDAVHNAVMEVIDQMTAAKGIRALSEFERKPTLKSFAQSA